MKRKIVFDKPIGIDINKLEKGAIFLVDGDLYMKIDTVQDELDDYYNCVRLLDGDLYLYDENDIGDFIFEYFPNLQNIKIVGD